MTTKTGRTQQIAIRLPHDMLEEVDRRVQALRDANPGIDFTRADVVRQLVMQALGGTPPPPASSRRRK